MIGMLKKALSGVHYGQRGAIMKNITSSVYSFEKLRREGYLYVDKTEFIWKLINPAGESYFLSRPRRFGKSLTLSTLKAIFEGKKELFKGLAIYDKPYDWRPYPIIHLSFGDYNIVSNAKDELPNYLMSKMRMIAQEHSIQLPDDTPANCFGYLIDKIYEKSQVVILVDEYDKPILDNITNPDVKEILKCLKGFYSVLKDRNTKERLLFITGVSKFCHVSLFSDLNNLTDITMDYNYAAMLGYTQEELETYFADRIELASKQLNMPQEQLLPKIKAWYDGYRFHEEAPRVYNPVSLAEFFTKRFEFNNYWFTTGTPSFLLELIMKSKFNLERSFEAPVGGSFFNAFELNDLDPQVLLFQTGYLTIDRAEQRTIPFTTKSIKEYYLRFPNQEVEESFNDSLLAYCTTVRKQDTQELILKLVTAVGTGDADGLMVLFKSVFAGIPYQIHVKDEHYYQTVFYVICDLLKLAVQAEVATNDGMIDMVIHVGEWIFVIEFKLNKTADEAMKQIENKEYALKYHKEDKKIMLLGVNFDFNSGNITNWIKEEYR